MKLHRYLVRPLSPWGTPLRGDTLYGLVLWRIAELDGDAACRETIAAFRSGRPPFVLSSAMPQGMLFAPRLPPAPRAVFRRWVEEEAFRDTEGKPLDLYAALQAYKRFRKMTRLPVEVWIRHAPALSVRELFAWHCRQRQEKENPKKMRGSEPHVSIDRGNGRALEGGLFFTRLEYFSQESRLHVYARTDEPDRLLALLRLVGELGFGRDASTGKGRFSVEPDADFDPASLDVTGTDSLLLSPCAAPDMAGLEGWYATEVKRGKAGPGASSPFKNPLLLLREGSLLRALPQGPCLLDHIHGDADIVQVTQPLTLPCRMIGEV